MSEKIQIRGAWDQAAPPAQEAFVPSSEIRKAWAGELARMYQGEVDVYGRFGSIVDQSNRDYASRNPGKVTEADLNDAMRERHGAIRVGTADEYAMIARVFRVMGMMPVHFYDLTTAPKPVPVYSTGFRPETPEEMAVSPFRMFTSLFDPSGLDPALKARAEAALAGRSIFSDRLIELVERAESNGGLSPQEAREFVAEAVQVFRMDPDHTVDFGLYRDLLGAGGDVAADIVCFRGPHLNHLTPKIYDIQDAHDRLNAEGLTTIENIQGPKTRPDAVNVLLNQTSIVAQGEDVLMGNGRNSLSPEELKEMRERGEIPVVRREPGEATPAYLDRVETARAASPHGIVTGTHKARFGEIEVRGVALTPEGEKLYNSGRQQDIPHTHRELALAGLAYYTFELNETGQTSLSGGFSLPDLAEMIANGWVDIAPVLYEDFLPMNAAGIFASNLSSDGQDQAQSGRPSQDQIEATEQRHLHHLHEVLGPVGGLRDHHELYAARQQASIEAVMQAARGVLQQRPRPGGTEPA